MSSDLNRVCPRCISAMVIPVLNPDHHQAGWECTTCGLEWTEKPGPVIGPTPDRALPLVDPIRGGKLE